MSIYIPGMEMPTRCGRCDMRISVCDDGAFDHYECCITAAIIDNLGEKMEDCPLVPVPPHGRLIDKDALEQDISESVVFSGRERNAELIGANKIINRLHRAPTVIPASKAIPVPDHGQQDGLYSKYFVIKTETGEIVQDCFVLRPQKDKAAVAALLLYAKETKNQELSRDIRQWLSTIIPAEEGEV